MAENTPRDGQVHGESSVRDTGAAPVAAGGMGWLPWLIGLIILAALLFFLLRGCDTDDRTTVVAPAATTAAVAPAAMPGADEAVAYRAADLDSYLAGQEPVGRAYALDKVTFASGKSDLDKAAMAEIADVAGVLKRYPTAAIALIGYADPAGDAAANQALSRDRAEAVRDALVKDGADKGKVSLAAEGETGTAPVRANRRVEMRVTSR